MMKFLPHFARGRFPRWRPALNCSHALQLIRAADKTIVTRRDSQSHKIQSLDCYCNEKAEWQGQRRPMLLVR